MLFEVKVKLSPFALAETVLLNLQFVIVTLLAVIETVPVKILSVLSEQLIVSALLIVIVSLYVPAGIDIVSPLTALLISS